jgi:prephenate dehydrogenase
MKRAVDGGTLDLREGVKDADLIILAGPVRTIPPLGRDAIRWARKGAVITDVGSTKSWIVGELEKSVKRKGGVSFVGSHPMAGSEHAGVEFARADLLDGSPCIVTKTKNTSSAALNVVAGFWKALGANVSIMSTSDHDRNVAMVSHLPHMVAFSLAGAVPEKSLPYAAEGFRDTTRVASSDAGLWADIFLSNRDEVARSAKMFERYHKQLVRLVSKGDHKAVSDFLAKAKAKRDTLKYGKTRQ